jgi:sulfate adenylyltransferase subunit 1 (EFTu-like GTPase family)
VLEALEQVPTSTFAGQGMSGMRLPVQLVDRSPQGAIRIAGMLTGGEVQVSDEVVVLPGGERTRVTALETLAGSVPSARAPLSVWLTLADGVGAQRGDLIASAVDPPVASRDQLATVCWFADHRLCQGQEFVVKHTTRLTTGNVLAVDSKLDLNTLRLGPASYLDTNDIGIVRWRLADAIGADQYQDSRASGSFIAIDPDTNVTVAAAMVGAPTVT